MATAQGTTIGQLATSSGQPKIQITELRVHLGGERIDAGRLHIDPATEPLVETVDPTTKIGIECVDPATERVDPATECVDPATEPVEPATEPEDSCCQDTEDRGQQSDQRPGDRDHRVIVADICARANPGWRAVDEHPTATMRTAT